MLKADTTRNGRAIEALQHKFNTLVRLYPEKVLRCPYTSVGATGKLKGMQQPTFENLGKDYTMAGISEESS